MRMPTSTAAPCTNVQQRAAVAVRGSNSQKTICFSISYQKSLWSRHLRSFTSTAAPCNNVHTKSLSQHRNSSPDSSESYNAQHASFQALGSAISECTLYIYMYTYMYIHKCIYIYVCIYIYMYIYGLQKWPTCVLSGPCTGISRGAV